MTFPIASVLDNANRANEGPPPSANWTTVIGGHTVATNRLAATGAVNTSYWNVSQVLDGEVFVTLVTRPADTKTASVLARYTLSQSYLLGITRNDAGNDTLGFYYYDGVTTNLLGSWVIALQDGDTFGLRFLGSNFYVFYNGIQVGSVSDSSIAVAGYIGISTNSTATIMDDFGGGSIPTLDDEMDSANRQPASQVTVERWLPEWTARISGLSGGATEQYAHGHGVAVAPNGSAAGEDIICRARSGSYANPQDGKLYIAIIRDANLDTPANWESHWVDTGITGLMYPAWTANSGAAHGGSIAVVHSGTDFRVFYLLAGGDLRYIDVSYAGGASGSALIDNIGTGVQHASMQIAACSHTEVFILLNWQVEASLVGWQPPVYGSHIRRYRFAGSWGYDDSFPFHLQAEGGLVRDDADKGADFGDASAADFVAQWGKRMCGGLGACQVDANTVLVSVGLTTWRRWGYDTHSQGVMTFIYHRDADWWERGPESDILDFNEDSRLQFTGLVRAWQIEGWNFISWNRYTEPSDYEQVTTGISLPRINETVMAKISADGRALTQFLYLGGVDELSAAVVIVVNHGGSKKLYALGWRSVYEAEPAAFLCSVITPQDLAAYAKSWTLTRNNRQGMELNISLTDPAIVIDPDSVVKSGALARIRFGNPIETIQVGQGFIDINTPELRVDKDGRFSEGATLNCRADEILLNTRVSFTEDFSSQRVKYIEEGNQDQVTIERGSWIESMMNWPGIFFSGVYPELSQQSAWRLQSFPLSSEAGLVIKSEFGRTHLSGSWYKDVLWINTAPRLDGAIQASVRFGNNSTQGNFTKYYNRYAEDLWATVTKVNGVVQRIIYSKSGYGGSSYLPDYGGRQYAVMAGLMLHAEDFGRRYAFIWEHNSDFSNSTYILGPWTGEKYDSVDYSTHGVGSNRLYLVAFDYSGDNWIAKTVAGVTATGLTPGYPADLRMQVVGGTIYCFYRPYSTTDTSWYFAFSYKAGRFGPGKFGLIGRGGGPLQWSRLEPGLPNIARLANEVDFWNIRISDTQKDQTLRDHLQRRCWTGFTGTQFRDEVLSESSRVVTAGGNYNYAVPVENLAIDFKMNLSGNNVEGGVFVRGVAVGSPLNECIQLGLVAHATANSAGSPCTTYMVKRRYYGGSLAEIKYLPLAIQLKPGVPIPVRVTARGPIYSMWLGDVCAGQFLDQTPLGLYFGLYAIGGTATFSDIYVPELYEVVDRLTFETNQGVDDVLRRVIGNRRIKAIYTPEGDLKFSYFNNHDEGPAFGDGRLWQSSVRRDGRFFSKIRLEGKEVYAFYQSSVLAGRGARFQVVTNQDITQREFAYKEARAIVTEQAEKQQQATFTGLIDIRIEPEDKSTINISRQNVAGDFIVEDINMTFEMDEESPQAEMTLSTRQTVAL